MNLEELPLRRVAAAILDHRFQAVEVAARLHTRSLELDPSHGDVLRLAAIFATLIRREDQMLRLGEMSVERDPLCEICLGRLVDVYMQLGMLDKAERLMLATADPGLWRLPRATVRLLVGDPAAALSMLGS